MTQQSKRHHQYILEAKGSRPHSSVPLWGLLGSQGSLEKDDPEDPTPQPEALTVNQNGGRDIRRRLL